MALLMQMMRTAAISGQPEYVNAWFADRQGGRWAEQMVRQAFPPHGTWTRDPKETRKALDELRESGVLTDDEHDRLRKRLRA